jgi:hypothetical protein
MGRAQETSAVYLEWEAGDGSPRYSLFLPPATVAGWGLTARSHFSFDLANASDDPANQPDLMIEVVDAQGNQSRVRLSDLQPAPVPLPTRFTKWPLWEAEYQNATEPIFQSIRLSLAHFLVQNPELNVTTIETIHFHFDTETAGSIYLDELGFTP